MALAHLPDWRTERINNLIKLISDKKVSLSDFFGLKEDVWRSEFNLNDKEVSDLTKANSKLPNLSFLAEKLFTEGFEIIPLDSPEYSTTLSENLGSKSPPILYVKGNKQLLNEECVAVVGSRDAADISLRFTENLAIQLAKQFKVVVSGFAKGVDKKSLDASIENHGNSIIVLPQGILTFSSGFKKYYPQLVEGQILVVSTFFPKSPWSVGLAMARNAYIYGLAKEIYVAESGSEGGTWQGAVAGLRNGRKVYVRVPEKSEDNGNELLIQKGAIPVDFFGGIVSLPKGEILQVSETRKKYQAAGKPKSKKKICNQPNLFDKVTGQ